MPRIIARDERTCQEANTGASIPRMASVSPSPSPSPSPTLTPLSTTLDPFKYVGGDAALDFVNTVDWTSRGLVRDRLTSYDRLVAWAEGAGVVSREAGRALLTAGRSAK